METYVELLLAKIDPALWDTPADPKTFPLRFPTEEQYAIMLQSFKEIETIKDPKTRRHAVWKTSQYMEKVSSENLYIREEVWGIFKSFEDARRYINQDTSLDDGGWYNFVMLTEKTYGISCLSGWDSKREFYRINFEDRGCSVEQIEKPKRLEGRML